MVEIARALSMKSRLIVMDEPTSALSRTEVEKLFAIIRDLKRDGISDDLRHASAGRGVRDLRPLHGAARRPARRQRQRRRDDARRHHPPDGRAASLACLAPRDTSYATGEVALAVDGPVAPPQEQRRQRHRLHDVSLAVRKGEILGIAGLVGAGRTEMARAIFGADRDRLRQRSSSTARRSRSPRRAMPSATASAWCPRTASSRRCSWRSPSAPICRIAALDRISALRLFSSARHKEEALVDEYRKLLNIRMAVRRPARRQPLRRQPAEGGAGPLAGAAAQGADRRRADARHRCRRQGRGAQPPVPRWRAAGIAIIVISSELPEMLALSDRIVTMREGRVTGEIAARRRRPGKTDDADDAASGSRRHERGGDEHGRRSNPAATATRLRCLLASWRALRR